MQGRDVTLVGSQGEVEGASEQKIWIRRRCGGGDYVMVHGCRIWALGLQFRRADGSEGSGMGRNSGVDGRGLSGEPGRHLEVIFFCIEKIGGRRGRSIISGETKDNCITVDFWMWVETVADSKPESSWKLRWFAWEKISLGWSKLLLMQCRG